MKPKKSLRLSEDTVNLIDGFEIRLWEYLVSHSTAIFKIRSHSKTTWSSDTNICFVSCDFFKFDLWTTVDQPSISFIDTHSILFRDKNIEIKCGAITMWLDDDTEDKVLADIIEKYGK